MKLSIIVAAYNVEKHIVRLLLSLFDQSITFSYEIIVVDDGSTDNTNQLVKQMISQNGCLMLVSQENQGLVSARRVGFDESKGEYIAFIDGDDFIDECYFNQLYTNITKYSPDIIACGHKTIIGDAVVHKNKNLIPMGYYDNDDINYLVSQSALSGDNLYYPGLFTYTWNKLFRRQLVDLVIRNIDERITIGEDALLTFGCLTQASSLLVVDSHHYNYVQHNTSMMNYNLSEKIEYQQIKLLYDNLETISYGLKRRLPIKHIEDYICSLLFIRCPNVFIDYFRSIGEKIEIFDQFNGSFIFGSGVFARILSRKFPSELALWSDTNSRLHELIEDNCEWKDYRYVVENSLICRLAIFNNREIIAMKKLLREYGFKGKFVNMNAEHFSIGRKGLRHVL
jgi:glycosyltransferase involved in cell wall biosynthesis